MTKQNLEEESFYGAIFYLDKIIFQEKFLIIFENKNSEFYKKFSLNENNYAYEDMFNYLCVGCFALASNYF